MRFIEKMKKRIRSFLDIQEESNGVITLTNLNNFETEANMARVWSWGDKNAIEQMYKQVPNSTGLNFWKATPSLGLVKRHTGLPQQIIKTLVNIIMADMNDIEVSDDRTEEWKSAKKAMNIKKILKEAVTETLIVGDGAFRISAAVGMEKAPTIDFVSGENVEYRRIHGQIKEIIFKERLQYASKAYVHEEIYGYGYVRNELYNNDKVVRWGSVDIPELRGMPEEVTFDDSFIMAVQLIFVESNRYKGRGQSLFSGKFDNFDSLDETWSQWVDALRKGRSKEWIPKNILPVDPDTGEIGILNDFDNKFIATEGSVIEGVKDEIKVTQPAIQHESYLATYVTALDLCLQGIISPSTLGIDTKKLDNAEAQREKEKTTLYTRNNIVDALQETVPMLIDAYFKTWDTLRQKKIIETEAELPFGEYANPSFESQVETVTKAKTGGIMSTEAAVEELYGDTKEDVWKKEEIKRIKTEQGVAFMEEPGINNNLGGFATEEV